LLSARAGEEAKIQGYDLGADDYLVKPFSARELLARVRAQIRITRARRHVEEQLRNLFMQAPVAIGIFKGPDFRIEVANENMLAIWDRRAEEVLNKPQFEAVPEIRHQGFEELFARVYSTGERYVSPESLAIIRRRGQLEQVYIKFVFEALHEEVGRISGVMVVAHEITDLVVSRKAAEMASERSRLAIEAAAMGTFDWDLIKLEFAFSPRLAEIFGFDHVEGVTHADLVSIIHPEDQAVRKRALDEALNTGVLFYEARLIWRDGTLHWMRTDGKVLYSDQHIPMRMLGTVMDITGQKMETETMERKVAERTEALREANLALENSNRELEQFAYIASHDLQTFSELLNRSIENNPEAQRYSDKIYTSAQRMSMLIQAVLNYSRLTRSGDEFCAVDLNEVLDNVRTDFELLIEEKGAVIKSDTLPVVRGIALQLHQLFSNLVGNALKFTDDPPVVTITATPLTTFEGFPGLDPARRYVRLTFADQGIGFDQRYAEQIFTIFQRLNHKRYSGTGIGLALCKRIVDNHNGAIVATSQPNNGATFTVCLPLE
jgi:PAS domain S-box-containing protein